MSRHYTKPAHRGILANCAVAWLAAVACLASPSAAVAGEQPAVLDSELEKYWNTEQAVVALSNPLYERKGGIEGGLKLGTVPNDNFFLFTVLGGRVGYFLTDTVAIEADFSYMMAGDSKIRSYLSCVSKSNDRCIDLTKGAQQVPKLNYTGAIDVSYSPFHGKMGVFDKKLSSFDLSVSAGLGLINADIDESLGNKAPVASMRVGGHWGAGFRFYLTRFLNAQVNYRQFLYQPIADGSFLAPVEFTVGVAYLSK